MSPETAATMIRMCLVIISLTITWLALASLSSAIVHFAVVLRDRAKSDLVTPADSIGYHIPNLMDNVVDRRTVSPATSKGCASVNVFVQLCL